MTDMGEPHQGSIGFLMSEDLVEAALDASADAAYAQWTRALWALRRHRAAKGDQGAIADCASMDAILNLRVSPAPSGAMGAAQRYSHSDGKGSPELKARFDAVCMAASPDPMKDWLSPRDYVGGPLVVAANETSDTEAMVDRVVKGVLDGTVTRSQVRQIKGAITGREATDAGSDTLGRAIGAKKP